MDSLLSQFSSFKVATYVGVEDAADKASFLFSVVILVVCSIIISTKEYILNSMSCYIPITVSGEKFDDYVKNYCWVHGTIPFRSNETLPQTEAEWLRMDVERRLNYYQWVPFVLGLQGILFYLPRMIWQIVIYNLSGSDLEGLVVSAKKSVNQIGKARKDSIEQIAKCLEDMFFQRRILANSRFPLLKQRASMFCCSRRTGVFLFSLYFIIKILYLVNAIGQIYLMQHFLRVGTTHLKGGFGITILKDIISGTSWNDNLMFPRVAYCYIGGISGVGIKNPYLAQCALPVNMLNEKIYIFLWFWTVGVLIVTLLSVPLWVYRMSFIRKRRDFVKKFLKVKSDFEKQKDKEILSQFVNTFLRHDGVFLLRIISLNAGDLVTTDIVSQLWKIYKETYTETDFRKAKVSKGFI